MSISKMRFSTRRQQSYASFRIRGGRVMDSDKLFTLQLTDKQLQDFFADFHKDANTRDAYTEWGKARRAAADTDIMYRTDRKHLSDSLPDNGNDKWFDRIHNRIDAERGRLEEDDIMPGVIRTRTGYKCSKFIPGEGVKRRYFLTKQAAVAWMEAINELYNRKAY